jgi:hypothetical protein
MPRLRSGDLTVVAIALAAIVVVTAAGALVSPRDGYVGGRASSFSVAPDGAKAAFLALKQLGYTVERSYEPLTAITSPPAQTTLVIANPVGDTSAQDQRAIRQFVERGGIVLATGSGGATLLGAKVHYAAAPFETPKAEVYQPAIPSPLAAGAAEITMGTEASATFGDEYLSIYGPEQSGVVRAARPGSGAAIWWAGATPLTNGAIGERGNFALLMNAVGGPGRTIIWDEHYHGYSRSLWSYAKATPLPWVGVQLGILAVAAALTFSRRREPTRPAVVDPRTSPMEFVDTVGGLYARAGAAASAVAAARDRLRRLLVSACGLAPSASDDRLAHAAARRLALDPAALNDLLARAARDARNGSLTTEQAVPIVQELQATASAVLAARSHHVGRAS